MRCGNQARRSEPFEVRPDARSRSRNGPAPRARIICLLALPVLGFAAVDSAISLHQGTSLLGPALDCILAVFGTGLATIALTAATGGHNKRMAPPRR